MLNEILEVLRVSQMRLVWLVIVWCMALALGACGDSDDSGRVDIGDAIYLLTFLFINGAPPAVPFPHEGIDPTDDQNPPCVCP